MSAAKTSSSSPSATTSKASAKPASKARSAAGKNSTEKKAKSAPQDAIALLDQLEATEPDGETYDAKVKVLSEYVKHHVKEEHEEMFPKAEASSVNMDEREAAIAGN
jgi:uncharacterized protein involved in copper resistance